MSHLLHILVNAVPYCHLGRPCIATGACGMALSAAQEFALDLREVLGGTFSVDLAEGSCPISGSGLVLGLEVVDSEPWCGIVPERVKTNVPELWSNPSAEEENGTCTRTSRPARHGGGLEGAARDLDGSHTGAEGTCCSESGGCGGRSVWAGEVLDSDPQHRGQGVRLPQVPQADPGRQNQASVFHAHLTD
jgi:hypothetical protein